MVKEYKPEQIEKKWQEKWQEKNGVKIIFLKLKIK